jgi:acyl-homoserine lactone acylase PvdQ
VAVLQKHMDGFYDRFLGRVATGRKISKERVDSLGEGRIFTGSEAVKNGLVDALGGMDEAVAELTKRLGSEMSGWKYGQEKYHYALIRHPLSDAVNAATLAKLNVGPLPRGGDGNTVSATGGADNQGSGGSLKIIADTEDWDKSVGLNTPGQSGDPDSPHYRDLFPLWARGEYFPIAYSKAKVESVRESTLRLSPTGTATQQR